MNERVEVAVAMLHRQGKWLLQLRDDIEGIIAPGCWGLFGGHVEPGESIEAGLRRELNEEIDLVATTLHPWFCHTNATRHLHVFVGPLPVPLESLNLKEGQDLTLTSLDAIATGEVQSQRLGQARPLAGCLEIVIQRRDEIKTLIAAQEPETRQHRSEQLDQQRHGEQ